MGELGSTHCLLCDSSQSRVLERIESSRLAQAYQSELGITVSLPGDEIRYLECAKCGLRYFAPQATGDEAFYGELQRIPWYYSASKQEFLIAARQIENHHRVLEIGAGRGLFTKVISAATYTGLEFSPDAIRLAAEQGIHLLSESIEQHALAHRETYDVACSFQVLEHVARPRAFLDSAVSCLKSGGRLIISVPGEDSFARAAYWDVLNMPPHHMTRWSDACLRSIAELFGLRLIALTPEPLGRNMVRLYANAIADSRLAKLTRMQPVLLDARLRAPLFRSVSSAIALCVREYLKLHRGLRRGHAVVAVFQKN